MAWFRIRLLSRTDHNSQPRVQYTKSPITRHNKRERTPPFSPTLSLQCRVVSIRKNRQKKGGLGLLVCLHLVRLFFPTAQSSRDPWSTPPACIFSPPPRDHLIVSPLSSTSLHLQQLPTLSLVHTSFQQITHTQEKDFSENQKKKERKTMLHSFKRTIAVPGLSKPFLVQRQVSIYFY